MPRSFIYCRKIDQLEEKKAKVFTKSDSPYKGEMFLGNGGIPCLGTDKNGDDIDGVTFTPDNGGGIIFIEDDIEKLEFID